MDTCLGRNETREDTTDFDRNNEEQEKGGGEWGTNDRSEQRIPMSSF